MSTFVKVGKKKDFNDGVAAGVQANGQNVCVARVGDTFYAFENRCTHAESLLSGGDVEDGEISCPLHGARFSIKTGEAMALPAVKPVQTYEVKLEGDEVWIKI